MPINNNCHQFAIKAPAQANDIIPPTIILVIRAIMAEPINLIILSCVFHFRKFTLFINIFQTFFNKFSRQALLLQIFPELFASLKNIVYICGATIFPSCETLMENP